MLAAIGQAIGRGTRGRADTFLVQHLAREHALGGGRSFDHRRHRPQRDTRLATASSFEGHGHRDADQEQLIQELGKPTNNVKVLSKCESLKV